MMLLYLSLNLNFFGSSLTLQLIKDFFEERLEKPDNLYYYPFHAGLSDFVSCLLDDR